MKASGMHPFYCMICWEIESCSLPKVKKTLVAVLRRLQENINATSAVLVASVIAVALPLEILPATISLTPTV